MVDGTPAYMWWLADACVCVCVYDQYYKYIAQKYIFDVFYLYFVEHFLF